MIKFKRNVKGRNILSLEMNSALDNIDEYHARVYGVDTWVTSTDDGKHMKKSKHYDKPKCNASDLRIWHLLEKIRQDYQDILGPDYDVVFEGDHFHIEYDPK